MPHHLKSRLMHSSWLVSLCAAVGLFAPTSAGAITSAQCDARANDTPAKLVPCIQTDDLWNHMQAFQAIADANPGLDGHPSRNSGEPGYRASADYVAQKMEDAGYDVTIQPYKFTYYVVRRDADVERDRADAARLQARRRMESRVEQRDGQTPQVQPAGGIVIPPTHTLQLDEWLHRGRLQRLHAGQRSR